jgi:hypothetical protein
MCPEGKRLRGEGIGAVKREEGSERSSETGRKERARSERR